MTVSRCRCRCRRRHRVRARTVVVPQWPRRMACLQRLAGTHPVSLWSWSVQRARGRPGRCPQSLPSERPDARPTWKCRALCAGVPWVSRAIAENWQTTSSDEILWAMIDTTGDKPVRADISAFVTWRDHAVYRPMAYVQNFLGGLQTCSGGTSYVRCLQEECTRVLLFRGANKTLRNKSIEDAFQTANSAGHTNLADVIRRFSANEVGL